MSPFFNYAMMIHRLGSLCQKATIAAANTNRYGQKTVSVCVLSLIQGKSATTATAAVTTAITVITAIVIVTEEQNQDNKKQNPCAATVAAAKQITQTHSRSASFPDWY